MDKDITPYTYPHQLQHDSFTVCSDKLIRTSVLPSFS